MVLRFKIKVTKGRDLPQRLTRLKARLEDRSAPLQQIKKYVVGRWVANFLGQGSEYGGWAPLSPNSWRRGDGAPGTPLIISGGLFGNVVGQSAAGVVSHESIDWTLVNGDPGWPLSHQGGWNPFFAQPPRMIWALDGKDEAAATRIMEEWVDRQVGMV